MRLPALVAAGFALVAGIAAADPVNSCTDPYWKDTLRCVFFPHEVPQPNLHTVPQVSGNQAVPAFTRVWLDENETVRCTDGTMPLIYVDKAVCTNASGCGNGVRRGDPIESNKWVITMSGGDSCFAERCGFWYTQGDERIFMGSTSKPAAKEMDGIHDPDPVRNPVFATYNRVRIEKCSFDRYLGNAAEEAPGGAIKSAAPDGTTVSYNAYHHGWRIIQEAVKALDHGLRYTTWRRADEGRTPGRRRACCGPGGSGNLVREYEALPPLANAEQVLLIGHSNASHGLYHNVDNIADLLASIPGFHGDVRALFDENFLPSIENEVSFATGAPPGRDLYDGVWSGTTSGRGAAFSYDGETHHKTYYVDREYLTQGALFDASCMQTHAADGTDWKCHDRLHVMANHISTPVAVRQDLTDPNRDHLDAPNGHWVRWGSPGNYSYCPDGNPCDPRFNPAEFRSRIEKQIETLLTHAWTRGELARGIDRTPGPLPTIYAWMPVCGQHDGSFSDAPFYGTTIATDATSFSMRQWLEDFMSAPRSGVRKWQIDGAQDAAGRTMRTSRCN